MGHRQCRGSASPLPSDVISRQRPQTFRELVTDRYVHSVRVRGLSRLLALLVCGVGAATLNQDNSQLRGQRRIWGGRACVRRILYMATVSAVQHNPAICAFYTRLCDKGKPRKVALVTAMRKLLVMLNAIMRDQVPWQGESVTKSIHT